MTYSQGNFPENLVKEDPDFQNKLEQSKGWTKMTEIQRKICVTHWFNPSYSKRQVAEIVDCSYGTVCSFMGTNLYASVALELDKLERAELRRLAIKRIKAILLSENERIANASTKAALEILHSEGILRDSAPQEEAKDVIISWGDESKKT